MKRGFDTEKYLSVQKKEILKRMKKFDRLYLEIGGHLTYDGHASRVLPGYNPKTKLKLLKTLRKLEIIYCISAKDLSSKRRLGDFNLNYKKHALKDLRLFKRAGLKVDYVVITRFSNEEEAKKLKKILEKKVRKVYFHKEIPGYSKSAKKAIKGYKNNPVVPITSKLVIITGAAGGSGKMATTMSQIYADRKRKIKAGFAKFETFPIYNLALGHPINIAYEAATADLQDENKIDPYHFKKYKKKTVNYNRDIDNFGILMRISKLITKKESAFGYYSPTDMGVSNTKVGIIDEEICKQAAIKEIHRRKKVYEHEFKRGRESKATLNQMKKIIKKI
ncbi:DUF1846 family protein [Candidatus Pacearchaeota archaeon]|nr:DUF1846 family protein [Candidatus Pacearchaeota archaeon]